MEEKIIIESKKSNVFIVISVSICLIGLIALSIVMPDGRYGWGALTGGTDYSYYSGNREYEPDVGYFFSSVFPTYASFTLLPCLIIALLFYFYNNKAKLTVTNKRVYGNAAFGKRVDLPLDMVSAVGTSSLMGVAVTTSSGAIKFTFIENRNNIHGEISKLLIERQDNASVASKQSAPQSNAEELKKYKDLLDSGILTQAEFDAKKQQLLGL